MDQGLLAQAREGTLSRGLCWERDTDRGSGWQVTPSRLSLATGPSGPLEALPWGPEVQVSQTGFPTSHVHQLHLGELQ